MRPLSCVAILTWIGWEIGTTRPRQAVVERRDPFAGTCGTPERKTELQNWRKGATRHLEARQRGRNDHSNSMLGQR